MSVIFPLALPTTGTLSYSEVSSPEYQQLALEADASRALVRDTLKRAKRSSSPDTLSVVKSLENYLPSLFSILQSPIDVASVSPSWRLVLKGLASDHVIEPPRVQLQSIEFERGMILLTYSFALCLLCEQSFQSASDNRFKLCTAYLTKAQSVLMYLSANPPALETSPLDLQVTTINGLVNLVEGSLHMLILHKNIGQEEPVRSPGLLCRIALYATDKFSSSSQMLSKTGSLYTWILEARQYSLASAQRLMAIESESKGDVGRSLGLLKLAIETTKHKKSIKSLTTIGKDKDGLTAMTKILLTSISELVNSYEAQNNRIAFQKIPSQHELEQGWPSGREAVGAKTAWIPPDASNQHSQQDYSGKTGYY